MSVDKKIMKTKDMVGEELIEAQKFVTGIAFIATSAGFNFGFDEETEMTVLGNEHFRSRDFVELLLNSCNALENHPDSTSIMFSCFVNILKEMIDRNGTQFGVNLQEVICSYMDFKRNEEEQIIKS